MEIQKGTKVKLKSFSGTLTATKNTEPHNNYWRIIGLTGTIIDEKRYNERVLVLFEKDLDQYEVANHNPILNSLWILPSDLEIENK